MERLWLVDPHQTATEGRCTMIRAIALIFCIPVILLGGSLVHAQSQFKEVTIGQWTVSENLYGDADDESTPPIKPTGRPNTAYTKALNGREASLGFICPEHAVDFSFGTNDNNFLSSLVTSENFESDIYTKVDSNTLRPTKLDGGYVNYFRPFSISELMRGANFVVCPTRDDTNPACFTFSLKGFTAALKMVCPKR